MSNGDFSDVSHGSSSTGTVLGNNDTQPGQPTGQPTNGAFARSAESQRTIMIVAGLLFALVIFWPNALKKIVNVKL